MLDRDDGRAFLIAVMVPIAGQIEIADDMKTISRVINTNDGRIDTV